MHTDSETSGLVLLVVILACLARSSPLPSKPSDADTTNGSTEPSPYLDKFQAVYIVSSYPFAEIDEFVASSGAEYHLDVTRYTLPMKEGLESYLADRPSVKAVFVGTRRTDPHGEKLTHFDPTDAGWPPFMRMHPVIDWQYGASTPSGCSPLSLEPPARDSLKTPRHH